MSSPLRHLLLAAGFLATLGFASTVKPVAPLAVAPLATIPMTLAPWTGTSAPPLAPDVQKTLAADQYIRRYYAVPGDEAVEMDIAYYAQPRVGANMHSPLNCLPGSGWRIASVEEIPIGDGADAVQVRGLTVERGVHRYAMAYWFQSRDRIVSGEFAARFYLLGETLRRRPTDAGLVRVMAPITESGSAYTAVLSFASRLAPELAKILRG
jgi:EpsI family protein